MKTFEIVRDLLVAQLELDPQAIQAQTALDEVGLDSLAFMEFLFALEDRFHLKMPEHQPQVKTVGDIVDQVDRLLVARLEAGQGEGQLETGAVKDAQ